VETFKFGLCSKAFIINDDSTTRSADPIYPGNTARFAQKAFLDFHESQKPKATFKREICANN
jgi:hypothetical protein